MSHYINLHHIPQYFPISKRTVQRLIKSGKFPKGKKISERITIWNKQEIEEWLNERDICDMDHTTKGVYFIESFGYFKIGQSGDVHKRLVDLSLSSPLTMNLFGYVDCNDLYEKERFFHNKFKDKKVKREWFDLNNDDLKFVLKHLIDNNGFINYSFFDVKCDNNPYHFSKMIDEWINHKDYDIVREKFKNTPHAIGV